MLPKFAETGPHKETLRGQDALFLAQGFEVLCDLMPKYKGNGLSLA